MTLQGTTSYLKRMQSSLSDRQQTRHPTSDSHSLSSPESNTRRRYGLAPWHRKNSHETVFSVSSSIREVLMGKTPVVTPNPEAQYTTQNGKQYTKVDLENPDDDTFLSSEARRVNTPPLSKGKGLPSARHRGFFFDLSPPEDSDLSDSEIGKSPTSQNELKKTSTVSSDHPSITSREWWETAVKTVKQQRVELPPFELDVPEHLPSSPLCPANPKHKSGGTGICVYHGRRCTQEDS